ncbi:MAG: YbjN domain-containing protein [Rhodobacteraceae bacterium]|nr:YbjN domain-containing protein [Paracoccaceae bacterium]
MSLSEHELYSDEIHPIDIVESLAEHYDWEFDRVGDDQIAMAVEGQWKTYSITLAWSGHDEILRMIVTFDMDPPAARRPELFEALNAANDSCWTGAFSYWEEQKLMVFKYGLVLSGGQVASSDQINTLISNGVSASERFYPAFQLATWGEEPVARAMQVAIAEAYGRA